MINRYPTFKAGDFSTSSIFKLINPLTFMIILFYLIPIPLSSQSLENRDSLMKAMLSNNHDLLILTEGENRATFDVKTAKAGFLPDISFSSDISYRTNPESYTINAGDFYNDEIAPGMGTFLLPAQDYTVELGQNSRYEFSIILEQPLFTNGKLKNGLQAAELSLEAARLQERIKKEELTTQIDIILNTLTLLMLLTEENTEQRQTADELVRISRESHENGFLLYSDLLSIIIQSREVELASSILDEKRKQLLLSLRSLTGIETLEIENLQLPEEQTWDEYQESQKEALITEALENNSNLDLFELIIGVRKRKLNIVDAGGIFKPDIGLYFKLSYTNSALPLIQEGWADTDVPSFLGALGIRSLLFDGGKSSGKSGAAYEDLRLAELENEKNKMILADFIEKTLIQMELSRQKIEFYKLQIETDEERIEQKRDAWHSGYGDEAEVLLEKLAYHSHRIALLEEITVLLKNHFQLHSSLGRTE
ncbi:MAG: TolC family protein [Spirochaetales bacterium]|nr:TolC family protein [Spirochaetales bacterium]